MKAVLFARIIVNKSRKTLKTAKQYDIINAKIIYYRTVKHMHFTPVNIYYFNFTKKRQFYGYLQHHLSVFIECMFFFIK